MPLYEIVKADGSREKVEAGAHVITAKRELSLYTGNHPYWDKIYAPGTWLEVWRREGVGE